MTTLMRPVESLDFEPIKLRPARFEDGDLLLNWRNDPETLKASHNSGTISMDEHLEWLVATLNNPSRRLFIAEENGVPVGCARADLANGRHELSWTVAPDARGRGVARRMIGQLAQQISGPIRAEVKVGNLASIRIARSVGMKMEKEVDGVLHFGRESAT